VPVDFNRPDHSRRVTDTATREFDKLHGLFHRRRQSAKCRGFERVQCHEPRIGRRREVDVRAPDFVERVDRRKIRLLHLPLEQEALILGGNVLRLLRQVRVAGAAAQPSRSYGYTGIEGPESGARRTDHIVTERLPPGTQLEYEL
jgi:hypothetical protein